MKKIKFTVGQAEIIIITAYRDEWWQKLLTKYIVYTFIYIYIYMYEKGEKNSRKFPSIYRHRYYLETVHLHS